MIPLKFIRSLCAAAELACWAPVSGTFPWFAARFVDPALGFAMNFNYFYSSAMLVSPHMCTYRIWYIYYLQVPSEITAGAILITFWDPNPHHTPAYLALMCTLTCVINLFGARWFGESEVVFASLKLTLGIGLVFCGLILDLGGGPSHDRIGFRVSFLSSYEYRENIGADVLSVVLVIPRAIHASRCREQRKYRQVKSPHASMNSTELVSRFLAFLSVLAIAAYSVQGMELVAIAASETRNPRRNIKKAVQGVLFRIFLFFCLWILVLGMLVSPEDPLLLRCMLSVFQHYHSILMGITATGTAAQSPYVIAIQRAGIRVLPSIVNAGILTSAFSAANSVFFMGSRILYGAALRGQAPRALTYCTKDGTPIAAIGVLCLFPWLSFMSVSKGALVVFGYVSNCLEGTYLIRSNKMAGEYC
jgi:yeast amino acid transporter